MGEIKILSASAGSGKTYRLAYRYVATIIAQPENYRHILAVTFTNKATDEMKTRILSEIDKLARHEQTSYLSDLLRDFPKLTQDDVFARARLGRTLILHDYSHFAIMTIDKFFQRIVRSFMKELGIDLNYNLQLQTDDLLSSAADSLIENMVGDNELEQTVGEFVERRIADKRTWDLRRDIASLGKQLFNEEYLRSGTSELTRDRIRKRYNEVSSGLKQTIDEIHAVASEAISTMEKAGLEPSDFKGSGKSFAHCFRRAKDDTLDGLTATVIKAIDDPEQWYTKVSPHIDTIRAVYAPLNECLKRLKELIERRLTLSLVSANFDNFVLLADLSNNVQQICSEQNILPISNTSRLLASLVTQSESDAPFIYEKVGNWFDYYMIDEFQDTSTMQWDNFQPLIADAISRSNTAPVLLVGDVKQSIYRWRGGDWQILAHGVEDAFRAISSDTVSHEAMLDNYRSERRIVEFNNAFIKCVVEQFSGQLKSELDKAASESRITTRQAEDLSKLMSDAYCTLSQNPHLREDLGYATISEYDAEDKTLPLFVDRIVDLQQRGYRPSDIAVLVRSNDEGLRAANLLLDYKAQNPTSPYCFDVVTGDSLRMDSSRYCIYVIACLNLSQDINDDVSRAVFNRFNNIPFERKLSAEDMAFFGSIAMLSPEEAFERIVMHSRLGDYADGVAYIQALHQQILTFSTANVADTALFVRWWQDKGCGESLPMQKDAEAITIMTIHKSKGLEFKAVLIPYADWRYEHAQMRWVSSDDDSMRIPVSLSKVAADTSLAPYYYEEHVMSSIDSVNMLYVACTRASEELHIMCPSKQRYMGKIVDAASFALSDSVLPGVQTKIYDNGNRMVWYGSPHSEVIHKTEPKNITSVTDYPTAPVAARVKLRFPSQRYTEDGAVSLAPRDMGVMMHRAFEDAVTKSDVLSAVKRFSDNALLSAEESTKLADYINVAFANPIAEQWFSSDWKVVRNENDIIAPQGFDVRRPDRVMIQGKRAVVVDYKFGNTRRAEHRRQIDDYVALLRDMGYTDVEGYLWYVVINTIEKVA